MSGHRHQVQRDPLSAQERRHGQPNVTEPAHHAHPHECRARPRFRASRRATPPRRNPRRRPARGPGGAPTAPR
eukprot:4792580-Alexandrium_andersonii.AAC.1